MSDDHIRGVVLSNQPGDGLQVLRSSRHPDRPRREGYHAIGIGDSHANPSLPDVQGKDAPPFTHER